MKKLVPILFALCILSCPLLFADTISRISLQHELAFTEDFDYVTTFSDSLLHFYKLDYETNSFTLQHWTCNPAGEVTSPTTIYTYNDNQPGRLVFDVTPSFSTNYGRLYLKFIAHSIVYFIQVSDGTNIELDSFTDQSDDRSYTLFSPDYLYYAKYHYYTQPFSIHRYNLNTNSDDSLFVWSEAGFNQFLNIENKYLLIYRSLSDNLQNSLIIDSLQNVHPCSLTSEDQYPLHIQTLFINSSKISDNIYLASSFDGLVRDSQFGFIEMNNFNIIYHRLYASSESMGEPLEHYFNNVIPYGNGRFSCIDNTGYDGEFFRNFYFNGTGFEIETTFPNLEEYEYPRIYTRITSRYALGVTGSYQSPVRLICVDYINQTVTDTTLYVANNTALWPWTGMFNYIGENISYAYRQNGTTYLYLMKIIEATGDADPIQSPAILSHSAYPNPFKDNTTIKITLNKPETAQASIYNLKGQLVKDITVNAKASLNHELLWDGTNSNNSKASTGLYFYKARTSSGKTITGKLLLQK